MNTAITLQFRKREISACSMIENREKYLSQLDIPAKMRITPKVFSKKKLSRKFTKK